MPDLDPRPDEERADDPGGADAAWSDPRPGETREERRDRLRWAKRLAWAAGAGALLLAIAVGAAVWFLGTERGRAFVQRTAVTQFTNVLAEDVEVEVGRLEGNFLTGARLTGLVLRRDGEVLATVDTAFVDYTLRTLVRRTFSADELVVAGATVYARQREDGSFNVAGLLRPRERDTQRRPFTVLIETLALRRSRVEVRFWPPGGRTSRGDSVIVLDSLNTVVRGFAVAGQERLEGAIAGLRTVAVAPYGAARVRLDAAGAFTRRDLTLERLRLDGSNGTRLVGRTRLAFRRDELPVFDAVVDAAPLALADVRAFAPVPAYGDPRLRLTADSDGRRLAFSLLGALDNADGDDATLSLDGDLSRDTNGPLAYTAEGSLRRLDLGALTGNPALAGELTGDLRVDLRGTEPRALAGAVSVRLRESRLGGRAVERLTLDGDVAAGRVTFDLDGRIPGLDLEASGEARPFDPVPSLAVRAWARDLDLALLAPGRGLRGRVAGDAAFVGQGTSAADLSGTAALSLDALDVTVGERRLRLDGAEVDADIEGGFFAFDADARLAGGGGRVRASGTADTATDPLRYEITSGRLDALDPAAITGNPAHEGRLTGTFTLDGAGTDPRTMTLQATAALDGSRVGRYDLRRVRADVALRRGVADVDLDADLGAAGGLTAAGTVRPFADPLAYDLRGTLRDVDLAVLTDNPAQASSLTGAYTARGAGLDPRTLSLDATLALQDSRYGDYVARSSDVRARLAGGALSVTGDLDLPQGSLALDLTTRLFDGDGLALTFGERMCFRDLDAGAFTEGSDLSTSLTGCFTGSLAGLDDLETARAGGTLTLRRSTVNEAVVEAARAVFALADGALTADLDVTLPPPTGDDGDATGPPGRLVAAVQARPFDDRPRYAARGRTDRLDLGPFLSLPSDQPARFTTTFDVSGEGLEPETMTLAATLAAGGGSAVGPVRVDSLDAQVALADGILRVDRLSLDTDLADAEGSGTLALFNAGAASRFRLDGAVESLAPLGAYLDPAPTLERGTFSLTAVGRPGEPLAVAGRLEADRLALGETGVTAIDGDLDLQIDRERLARDGLGAVAGTVVSTFDTFRSGTFLVREGRFETTLDGSDIALRAFAVVDERRDVQAALRLNLDTDPLEIGLEEGTVGLDDSLWRIGQPARIVFDDGILVRGLMLSSEANGGQQILADGRLDFSGEQDLVATVENVRLEGIADLAGYDDLGGAVSATLALSGPAAAPILSGTIELDDLTAQGVAVGTMDAELSYADGRLGLDAILTHVSGETLTLDATIPRRFALADGGVTGEDAAADDEVTIVARANAFPIGWVEPFLDDRAVSELGGALRLDLTVSGTQAAPELDGVATVTDGRFGAVATGIVYPFFADVTFRGNRISLDDVRVTDDAGATRLDVDGVVRLRELSVGEFDLTIRPDAFTAIDTRTFRRLVLDAGTQPLRLTGSLTAPVLRGAVTLARGDIYVTDELVPPDLERVELTDEQLRTLEARFGRVITARDTAVSRFTDALDYDLTVQINRNVWLRADAGLDYDIEFEGDVQAVKRSYAKESQLFGQIELVRGSVQTLNRRFDVQRGTLTFNGPPLSAQVDLGATLDVRLTGTLAGQSSAQITLDVAGRLDDNPEIRLSSNPAMDPADIISVIATGQLSDNFASGSALGGVLGGALYGEIGGLLEGFASSNLGLDLAQIDVGEGGAVVIRVGKYLSNRLFFTGGFVVNPTQTAATRESQVPVELTLDYQLLRWLAAQGEFSGRRGLGGGLETQIAW